MAWYYYSIILGSGIFHWEVYRLSKTWRREKSYIIWIIKEYMIG
jgi:hypothetical protein